MSAETVLGRPTAATRMSAWAQISFMFSLREWQTVTVASAPFFISSRAMGLPTMRLRPITTARLPFVGTSARLRSSIMPAGVHATNARESS